MQLLLALTCAVLVAVTVDAKYFPRVRIFHPRPNDIWFTGEVRTIIWRRAYIPPPPISATVNITLKRVNDSSFSRPLVQFWPNELNAYQWKIPSDIQTGDDYSIWVRPQRPLAGRPDIVASKSKPFTIVQKKDPGQLVFSSPTEGSVWTGGQYRIIRFKVSNAEITGRVTASLFVQEAQGLIGFPNMFPVGEAAVTSSGEVAIDWQVPFEFRSSKKYQLRAVVQWADDSREPITGVSVNFEVVQPGAAGRGTPTVAPSLPTQTEQ